MNTPAASIDTAAPRVELRDVVLRYPSRTVLDGVHLTVRPGELVSVLGASGSGKSTLLRIVAGLLKPTAGDVLIEGSALAGPRPDVALAFQDPCLLPWLSVERNVAFGLGFARQPKLSRSERGARVSAALDEVGLAHARHYAPHQLSGGMAQRAALARCVARQPRTLLLDEPFGALDALTRSRLQNELQRIWQRERITMILVTHDVDEAIYLGDRVVTMAPRPGRVKHIAHIDLPRPRDRSNPRFVRLRDQILADFGEHPARDDHDTPDGGYGETVQQEPPATGWRLAW